MRNLTILIAALFLALPVSAEWMSLSGQLVTVRVEGVPGDTSTVKLDLGEKLRGLELQRDGEAWVGSFAALPELTNPVLRPEITVYDNQQHAAPLDTGKGGRVEMASSEFDGQALASGVLGSETRFVFDSDISPQSIELKGQPDSPTIQPLLGHQTFRLPPGVSPDTITSIVARTTEGRALVFSSSPETEVDVANTEEDL